ncbi:hypothetical protein [Lentilactobacillus buchneri]|nr:hypothetical protein [Lentilactobacillus buchneri]
MYSKTALVASTGFSVVDRDILRLVLDENKQYSLDEANEAINKFKGGIR